MAQGPKLNVNVGANVDDFEKKFERVKRTAGRRLGEVEKRGKQFSNRFQRDITTGLSKIEDHLSTFGRSFIAGAMAGGAGGIAAAVANVTRSIADLGREAKTAGINVEEFQKWRYVADQNRIGIDAMIDGFKELNIRADEYVQTGKGGGADAFAQIGMSPAEVKERLKDPSALLLEIIDRTKRLKNTAAGVRIFDELLGGQGGEQFVRLIEQGREGISATLKEADKMGVIMDENFIKKAEEVDKKFSQIATTIGSTLKGAIVDAVTALQGFISQWNALNEKSVSGIKAELDILRQSRERLGTTQQAGGVQDAIAGVFGQDRESQLARITEREKELNDELDRRKSIVVSTPDKPPVAPYVPPKTNTGGGKSSADRERDKAVKAAERERKAVTDLIAQLEFEASLVGKTALEKERLTTIRQAGAAATSAEKNQIGELVEQIYKESEAYEKTQERIREATDAGREFAGTLADGLLSGAKASEVLSNALQGLASRFLNSGLDQLFNLMGGGAGGSTNSISFTNFSGACA